MSRVPKLRFKEFSGEWEEKKLFEISEKLNVGFVGTCEKFYTNKENGIFLIRTGNLINSSIKYKNMKYITDEFHNKNKKSQVKKGDILIARHGSNGQACLYNSDNEANTLNIVILRVKKDIENFFLINQINSSSVRKQILAKTAGSTQGVINTKEIAKLKIILPQKTEQQKIASFLTSIDTKIEQLTKKVELLEQYKKGVMQKIFSQDIRFKQDNGSEFEEWEEKRLSELFNFLRGSPLSKSDIIEDAKNKCIHYGELFTLYNEKIFTIKSKTNLTKGQFSIVGDILMPSSDVTPQGLATASTLMERDVIIGGDINVLRPTTKINSIFISYFLNQNKNEIMKLVTGTTVKHIYNKDISKLKIDLPCLKEQTKKRLEETKEYKKGLLQQMFV